MNNYSAQNLNLTELGATMPFFLIENFINLNVPIGFCQTQSRTSLNIAHVGKYDRADDRPKLAMLAAKVGYRYWTDDRSRLG